MNARIPTYFNTLVRDIVIGDGAELDDVAVLGCACVLLSACYTRANLNNRILVLVRSVIILAIVNTSGQR